jgi:5-dehydro-2-deoxygluconokinase
VLDLDYRPMFWPDRAAATASWSGRWSTSRSRRQPRRVLHRGRRARPAPGRGALLERGLDLAVVKQGPLGVLAATRDEVVEVPPVPVEVVNGLGAGDAFGGALCAGLLAGRALADTIRFANAAGAIVASRLECSTAMPTSAEVEAALADAAAGRTVRSAGPSPAPGTAPAPDATGASGTGSAGAMAAGVRRG